VNITRPKLIAAQSLQFKSKHGDAQDLITIRHYYIISLCFLLFNLLRDKQEGRKAVIGSTPAGVVSFSSYWLQNQT
jgi:hypothetical protein